LGAALVFGAGTFFIALGRQIKTNVTTAMKEGGRISIPLAMLPFHVNQAKVGSIRRIDVENGTAGGPRRLDIRVRVNDPATVDQYANCLFQVDAPDHQGFFGCIREDTPAAAGLVRIGELTMDPGGIVRPIVISSDRAGEWFRDNNGGHVSINTGDSGATMQVTDANGEKVVNLKADSNGAILDVRDKSGKEVVSLRATKAGVKMDVKKQ
jgi:hypothetical protein